MNQNFPRYGVCTREHRIVMSFILGYFCQKVIWKLWKLQKTFFGLFLPILVQKENFMKNPIRFCHFFLFLNFYWCAEFQKKVMNRLREKLVTDVRTDKHEFMEPPSRGPKSTSTFLEAESKQFFFSFTQSTS